MTRCHLSVSSRKFLNHVQNMDKEQYLEKASLYNSALACVVLAVLSFDTLIAWYDNTYLATSYEDQISILSFFFGLIGYLMGCAIVQYFLLDHPFERIEWLAYAHFIALIVYFFHWILLPIDDWNPVIYYLPEFYEYTFLIFPLLLIIHLLLAALGAYVGWNDRSFNSKKIPFYMDSHA